MALMSAAISFVAVRECSANLRTSSATTAKPRPASPAIRLFPAQSLPFHSIPQLLKSLYDTGFPASFKQRLTEKQVPERNKFVPRLSAFDEGLEHRPDHHGSTRLQEIGPPLEKGAQRRTIRLLYELPHKCIHCFVDAGVFRFWLFDLASRHDRQGPLVLALRSGIRNVVRFLVATLNVCGGRLAGQIGILRKNPSMIFRSLGSEQVVDGELQIAILYSKFPKRAQHAKPDFTTLRSTDLAELAQSLYRFAEIIGYMGAEQQRIFSDDFTELLLRDGEPVQGSRRQGLHPDEEGSERI